MVVRQLNVIHDDQKQFLEELTGQRLGANVQVYIVVDSTEPAEGADLSGIGAEQNGGWSAAKNERRGDLIDKHIQGSILPHERVELDVLQQQFHQYQEQLWPLPIDKARELHQELLQKKREHEQRHK